MAGGGQLAQAALLSPRLLDDRLRVLDHAERVRRQIIEERDHLGVERRRQSLDAEEQLPLVDLLQETARLRRRINGGVGGGQDFRARVGARRLDRLPHRVQMNCVERPQRPLGGGVVKPNRFDLVAEELDPHRVAINGREKIDDRPPDRERPRILDHRGARKASPHQRGDRQLAIQRRLRGDHLTERIEGGARHDPAKERCRRGDQHPGREPLRKPEQRGHPAQRRSSIGLHLRVGRRVGRRELEHGGRRQRIVAGRRRRQEESEIVRPSLGRLLVGDDVEQDRAVDQVRGQRRAQRARGAVELDGARPAQIPANLAQRLREAAPRRVG